MNNIQYKQHLLIWLRPTIRGERHEVTKPRNAARRRNDNCMYRYISNTMQQFKTITINKNKILKLNLSQPIDCFSHLRPTKPICQWNVKCVFLDLSINTIESQCAQQYSTSNLKTSNLNFENLNFKILTFSKCSLLRNSKNSFLKQSKNLFSFSGATRLEPRCIKSGMSVERRSTKNRDAYMTEETPRDVASSTCEALLFKQVKIDSNNFKLQTMTGYNVSKSE